MTTPDKRSGRERADVAIVLVGSNVTAIAAELAVQEGGYPQVFAIARRGATTSLPILPDGSALVDAMKHIRNLGARKKIRKLTERIAEITGGKPYDCFIHHSMNAFSQILSSHPLCRRYYYIEEGITAMVGRQFGRPKKRAHKKLLWKLRSLVFFGGRIDKQRPFFDVTAANYGGACAISSAAFKDFPGRIQLPYKDLPATTPVPAEVMIFIDSQYVIGNCTLEEYLGALKESLVNIVQSPATAAIKFHPAERDQKRRQRIMDEISSLPCITGLGELPPGYVAEKMAFDPATKVFIGTSSLGFYTGERGFQTYTFAPRIAAVSPKFAGIMKEFPREFEEVCKPA